MRGASKVDGRADVMRGIDNQVEGVNSGDSQVEGGTALLMSVTGINKVLADGGMSGYAGELWNTEDDILVRHLARKMSLKDFGLLKACTEVLERYDEWWKELPRKVKLKENLAERL